MKCIIQDNGSNAILCFRGNDKEEILRHYYSCYNLEITSSEGNWLDEEGPVFSFYFWTSMEKIREWYYKSSLRMIINKRNMDEEDDEAIIEAKKLAEFRMGKAVYEDFFPKWTGVSLAEVYPVCGFNPDDFNSKSQLDQRDSSRRHTRGSEGRGNTGDDGNLRSNLEPIS